MFETNGVCHLALLQEVTPTKLVITWNQRIKSQQVTRTAEINRSNVLAVGAGHDIVYSGRSSWRDVQEAKPGHAERLHVTTTTGQELTSAVAAISDAGLTLSVLGRKQEISKSEIETIDYVRQRPPSNIGEYIAEEAPGLLLFAPDTWTRAAGISPELHVRLYDASLPEEDKELICQTERQSSGLAK